MKILERFCVSALFVLGVVPTANSAPWVACGKLSDINVTNNSGISGKPLTKYEYGIASSFNSTEPVPIIATSWNYGIRVYNKTPYFVFSDNPSNMKLGGAVFYSGTQAADDNCGSGNFRHRYWHITTNSEIITDGSHGCYGSTGNGTGISNPVVYCRLR